MRLIDRYLLRELLVPLAYCLCGFLSFWMFFDLFTELNRFQANKLLPEDIAEFYLVNTPGVLVIVLPMALLLASLYALTNHTRNNEITAIRAAGVSLWRLSVPYLAVGFVASIALFALNELCVPDSEAAAEKILTRRKPVAGSLGPDQVRNLRFVNANDGRKWFIGVYNIVTGEMTSPEVVWTLGDGTTRWLSAGRAIRRRGVWTFYNNVVEHKEPPGTNTLLVPLLQTNVLAMPEFSETPDEIKSEIRLSNGIVLRGAKKADIPLFEIRNYLRFHPSPSPSDRRWLFTKLHGRLAAPWTCIVVVLMAIPFGAASGRRNVFVGVAGSIVICFLYFVVQQVGLALGTGGLMSPWLAAWFPNLSFGMVGIWMTSRLR